MMIYCSQSIYIKGQKLFIHTLQCLQQSSAERADRITVLAVSTSSTISRSRLKLIFRMTDSSNCFNCIYFYMNIIANCL